MYQVIARKYRPQNFDDVVNQEHVKRTLANALVQGRVGHGYIFSGQRGTGKTTMARILAKALNCEKGPTAEPCLKCPSCVEIAAANSMDLVEIDAASNRRIDDIRELRENVRYRPVRDRYKVFIIDEAHQITADAFNALLKTLEEPPEWVVFILCTTEPHQFPSTIVSRCQNFPFRTVELELVIERLRWICEQEQVEADSDALVAMALAGDGSIRDSLSTLDQAIASFGKKLEAVAVRDLLGAIPSEITGSITTALREGKPEVMLDVVDQLNREGRHLQHFSGELARYFRNLVVMKVSGPESRLVTAGPDERAQMAPVLEHFSEEDLTRYLQLSLDLYRDLQHAPQPRFRLEIGLLKLVHAGRLAPIEKVLAEWGTPGAAASSAGGESKVGASAATRLASATPDAADVGTAALPAGDPQKEPPALSAPASTPPSAPIEPAKAPEARTKSSAEKGGPSDLQRDLIAHFRGAGDDFTADAIEHAMIRHENGEVEIRPSAHDVVALEINRQSVEDIVGKILGGKVRVKLGDLIPADASTPAASGSVPKASTATNGAADEASIGLPVSGAAVEQTEVRQRALADPEVQGFHEIFGGRIREVRDLRRYSS